MEKRKEKKREKRSKKEKPQKQPVANVKESSQEPQIEKVEEIDEENLASLIPEPSRDIMSDGDFEYVTNESKSRNGRDTAIEQFEKYKDEKNWTLIKDKDGIEVYYDENEKNGCRVKRTATVDLEINRVKEKLMNLDFIKSVNDKIEEIKEITEINEDTKVVYQKMKGNFLVSPRDMCYCACVHECRNDDIVICNYSVMHDSCPETKSVRGELMNYYYLHKISSDITEIRSILHIDLKGNIGSSIYSKFADTQYDAFKLLIEKLRQ